ncbi:hypothetical protein [Larsenimonas suaedae]|uniref:DUF2513 domain-containing protein n=1 Tax=Larsenimonas suaedae TaxID=1851019 RepID=A0ABU1GSS1_9GAMM|nr:hypothetical protein [Larsenimonas suaedae]MCM2972140.1 hypothetical protein [Larsenimonas suaedae]MDR5895066.1 hypothetical protein [Larsenimonas suaedae]
MNDTVNKAHALLEHRSDLAPLEALIVTALDDGVGRDTGRLARAFELEHALVYRSALELERKAWVVSTARSGRSPGLALALTDVARTSMGSF